MSSDVDIRVQNLSKVYRIYERPEHRLIQMVTLGRVRRFTEFSALHEVSLEIRRGETVGIVGRNGCGKSTLLQIICGTLQPTSGSLEVKGRVAALLELGAGFNAEFTGRENVYMNGAILGFSRAEMNERFEAIAAFAGIGDFIERPVKTYSSGMYVRLAFAVATTMEPDILIVDEALAVGDEAFQRKCFARIESIKERGGTILFVSHAAQAVVQLCDRAVLLDSGEKLAEGSPISIVRAYQRLVNSSGDAIGEIRSEIVAGMGIRSPEPMSKSEDALAAAAHHDFFDQTLVSETTSRMEERGARIENVRIIGNSGESVNVLTLGRRYSLIYSVSFACAIQRPTFGFHFRTREGTFVAGAHTAAAEQAPLQVGQGDRVTVRFDFLCSMLPNSYFLTCGVRGIDEEEEHLLHKIVDVLHVRVSPVQGLLSVGVCDLSIEHFVDVTECEPRSRVSGGRPS